MKPTLTLLLPDIRSAQNVGAILRTADAVGAKVWTSGITPYPIIENDTRPPYMADRAHRLIKKTALGAEITAFGRHFDSFEKAVSTAREDGLELWALEQSPASCNLFDTALRAPTLLVLGPEVSGLSAAQLEPCLVVVEIPMNGRKESLNVAVAAGIACYQLCRPL